uniref:Uncharacterized protein n=1 Tax=Populus trichocarpa TaxID=3694 RepID=A0A2K1YRW4_POPTR
MDYLSATKVLPKLLYLVPYNFGTAFHDGKKIQLPSFRDCLKEGGTVKKVAVGREAAIEVQDDTINLFSYIVQRLTPHALSSGVSSWSYLRRGNTPSYVVVGPPFATVSVSEQLHHLHATSPSQDNSYDVKRSLQHNRWQIDE